MANPTEQKLLLLAQKAKNLSDKLQRLQSGEINAEYLKGDGRQEEAIARNEAHLRGVLTEIENIKGAAK